MKKEESCMCKCGKFVTSQEFEFWGECEECRLKLPIHTLQGGDNHKSDRQYTGGNYGNGEW